MCEMAPVKALVFDLGDVLFTWSAATKTNIPAKTLRDMLKSNAWLEFDCGRIDQNTCYTRLAEQYEFSAQEIEQAFDQAFNSLKPNEEIIKAILQTKKTCHVKVYAMSNMPKEFYDMLASQVADWAIFDQVFTSGYAGMRKPDLSFYRHVLHEIQMRSSDVMFFDDRSDNVAAALALGIRSHVFTENQVVMEVLTSLENDSLDKGHRFLQDNKANLESVTNSGIVIHDNFATLLIQDTVAFDGLVEARWDQKRTWNYFKGEPVLVPGREFPDDLDTTSLALMVVRPSDEIVESVLNHMLEYVHSDGKFQTYFDWDKPRIDEIVSTNVLACFYHFGQGHQPQLAPTLEMIYDMLLQRTYLHGTRYYPHADCCLYFIGRLLRSSKDASLHAKLSALLKSRVQERVGQPGSTIELAMRIITCCALDVDCSGDLEGVLALQQDDGGWPASWMYRYGSTGVQIGNRGVTTAMAVKAIAALKDRS